MKTVKLTNWKLICVALAVCMGLLFAGILLILPGLADSGAPEPYAQVVMDCIGLVVIALILLSCAYDREDVFDYNRFFILMLATGGLILFFDSITWIVDGYRELRNWNICANYLLFILSPVLVGEFFQYILDIGRMKSKRSELLRRIVIGVIIADILFITSSLWTGSVFFIDEEGLYRRGGFYLLSTVYAFVILAFTYILLWNAKMERRMKVSIILYSLIPVLDLLNFHISVTYTAVYIGLILLYSNIYAQRGRQIYQQKALIEEQERELLISQAQPHFIFNTLNTVYALCDKDVDEVKELVIDFSKYLRILLDSENQLIPFEKELEFTRYYIEIEKHRFPDILFDFALEDTDFLIPSVTVQPLVENSIHHGVRGVENGFVSVESYQEDEQHVIVVSDNGVGIENALKREDGKKAQDGLSAITSRVEKMCGGTVEIESEAGKGTRVTIRIPRS